MAKQSLNLDLLLVSAQADWGVEETGLDAGDFIETIGPAKLKLNSNPNEIDLIGGGFEQDASIPGAQEIDLSLAVHARSNGNDAAGQFGLLLTCAGMKQSESTPTGGTFTYVPTSLISEQFDFTAWMYSGQIGTEACFLYKAFNGLFIPKWTFETGKPCVMDLSAKMCYSGIPALATQPTSASSPALAKQRTLPPAFMGLNTHLILNSAVYQIISAEIDMGQEAALTVDAGAAYGRAESIFLKRKIKWKAKCYKDTTVDPETALLGKTIAAVTFDFGVIPQRHSFSSTYGQITNISTSDEGGIETWDLEGIFERNDFTIIQYTHIVV
jgi:hypothetical protein